MNILLVDGNEKEASDRYIRLGMETQFEVYKNVLEKNSNSKINITCLLYTSPSPRDGLLSRMPSSA